MVPAACFHSFIKEIRNTAVQEQGGVTGGAQPQLIMTPTSSGDSAPAVFCATVAIRMVTAAIFRSCMTGKCTQPVPLRMKPNPGAPQRTTMTWTDSGVTVEVNSISKQRLNMNTKVYLTYLFDGHLQE